MIKDYNIHKPNVNATLKFQDHLFINQREIDILCTQPSSAMFPQFSLWWKVMLKETKHGSASSQVSKHKAILYQQTRLTSLSCIHCSWSYSNEPSNSLVSCDKSITFVKLSKEIMLVWNKINTNIHFINRKHNQHISNLLFKWWHMICTLRKWTLCRKKYYKKTRRANT